MAATPGALASAFLAGAIVALALLSALVAVVLRDRLYTVYAAALFAYVLYQNLEAAFVAGPQGPRLLAACALLAFLALEAVFARDFLELGPQAKRYQVLLGFLGLAAITVGVVTLAPGGPDRAGWLREAPALASALLLAYQLWLGFDAQFHRHVSAARWYALACAGLVIGLVLHGSGLYGVVPATRLTADLGGAGVAWQAVFISLALADRVRTLAEHSASLATIAYRDALTGVANRRAFDTRLTEEWNRAARQGSRLALLMIDVDCFKAYNDAYGHPRGDEVLRATGGAIAKLARRGGDFAARYGGEEFAVILPGVRRAAAADLAERIRADVRALAIPHRGGPAGVVTISCGVAVTRPRSDREPAALVAAADRALYAAKRAGRDRVVSAPPARVPSPTDSRSR